MLQVTDILLFNYFKWRQKKIQAVIDKPFEFQERILHAILSENKNTIFGRKYSFNKINSLNDYQSAVPLAFYEDKFNYIKRMMEGEDNVLTKEKVDWFAKSSGTSTGRSKYIPVSKSYLKKGHLKCAWDVASFIYDEDPTAKLFADKSLIMGGTIEKLDNEKWAGDISAVILHHFPAIGRRFYTPDFETALMADWDKKIEKMARITSQQNVTLLAGVPSWTVVLLNKILEITSKDNISEVWPNLKSFLHGGVGFDPYKETFQKLIPSEKVNYREAFNASEGYFAMQNKKDEDGMLLLCDHGIYYEFIPDDQIEKEHPDCLSLDQVELHKKYALVISNISGLYRYRLGDVVQFVSINPFKIKVVGREKESINVFGEEVSVMNTDRALGLTCDKFNVEIVQYTVAPIYMSISKSGAHEWFIEFVDVPKNLNLFSKVLDENLRQLNSDYDAKRSYDLTLSQLKITTINKAGFERWLRSNGKFGGQNKVPRLKNDRTLTDALMVINNNM